MVPGKLIVTEEVFVDIARASLQKVEDVTRQDRKGPLSGLGRILTGKLASTVNVKKADADEAEAAPGTVSFDLRLELVYGVNIPEVAIKVRDAVKKDVTAITGYEIERVDITVERLVRPEEIVKDA